ncbi:hypothetical protein KP509_01G127300 [Ceratopteris richardii]|uniref:Uncharacterized protein n=1 Tax=Ceratopteris richardii TaxID=49495 RepID=A0A8T2VHC1_CERRI|nr:hypothetical protein KP509_01G127300 [Ceratopteris richardii]
MESSMTMPSTAMSMASSCYGAAHSFYQNEQFLLRNGCASFCNTISQDAPFDKKVRFLFCAKRPSLSLSLVDPLNTIYFLKEPAVLLPTRRAFSCVRRRREKRTLTETVFHAFVPVSKLHLRRVLHGSCVRATNKQQMDMSDVVKYDTLNADWNNPKSTSESSSNQYNEDKGQATLGASIFTNEELLRRVALAESAELVTAILSQSCIGPGRALSSTDCSKLIDAALAENNPDLAYSILEAMRNSQMQRRLARSGERTDDDSEINWLWPQPDVKTYIALIKGLAATLRVSDAIRIVGDVKRRGVPAGDEVPFGRVVRCPTCESALAVVQPHQGVQLVPCSKCRYQYELMSGDVINCESESISTNISAFERGLRVLQLKKQSLPAAVHSFVVRSPDGNARTYRFATASLDIPAQLEERITVAAAAPANSSSGTGPLKISARAPGWRPSEPMSITNHVSGNIYPLLRAPPKSGSGADLDTSIIIPGAFLLASSDAATALIDPTLPRTIAIGAASAAILGTAANIWLLPRINQLPQRTADAVAVRQQLLAQYEVLQARLLELIQGATEEVRMLARLCQLQNKMEAVQEATYSARMERVCRARDGLDQRLTSRLELIDNYAKVSSMIEIEVEMDLDVLAAEAGSTASIAEQIERLGEVERLQKQWKIQAEANDELERLLQSSPVLPDSA